jgi:carbon starvation protein
MVLALYFAAKKRPVLPLLIPLFFTMAVALLALLADLAEFVRQGNTPLTVLAALLLALVLWMGAEGLAAAHRLHQMKCEHL